MENDVDQIVLDKTDILDADGLTGKQRRRIAKNANDDASKDKLDVLELFRDVAAQVNPIQERFEKRFGDSLRQALEEIASMGKLIVEVLAKVKTIKKTGVKETFQQAGFKFSYQTAVNYMNVSQYRSQILKNLETVSLVHGEYKLTDAYDYARVVKAKATGIRLILRSSVSKERLRELFCTS
jgi:hypothetical protein